MILLIHILKNLIHVKVVQPILSTETSTDWNTTFLRSCVNPSLIFLVGTCSPLLWSISSHWTSRELRLSLSGAEMQKMADGSGFSLGVWRPFCPLKAKVVPHGTSNLFYTWVPLWSSSISFPLSLSSWWACSLSGSSLPASSSRPPFLVEHWSIKVDSSSGCLHCTTKIR